ncbi:MAG: AcrR family transcriptional regulator [Verrucomicrobiales bacterium]
MPQSTAQIPEPQDQNSNPPQPAATRTRLLDAAEVLFAERGFESVSLRHITTDADVNLASVNYHFGSKEALIDEVIARRIQPINQLRLQLLDQCIAASGNQPLTLEMIVDCFVTPVIDTVCDSSHSERLYSRLMSRCLAESTDRFPDVLIKQFTEVIERFVGEMSRAMPSVTPEVHQLRILFMAGAMAHSLFHFDKLPCAVGTNTPPPNMAILKGEMINFIAAGLNAPSKSKS